MNVGSRCQLHAWPRRRPPHAGGGEAALEQRASELIASQAYAEASATLSRLMLGHVAAGRDDRDALAR